MQELKRSPRELFLWLLRRRKRFRVTGKSMYPVLKPGEEVLVDLHAYDTAFPCVGDIAIARHPHRPDLKMIKRVAIVLENGDCFLKGDNSEASTDSRMYGIVSRDRILGRVTGRFW